MLFFFGIIAIIFNLSCKEIVAPPEKSLNPDNSKNTPGWFHSDNLFGNRYINISLPKNYNSENTRKYHTVYLLDANWYFDGSNTRIGNSGVVGIINRLVEEELIPDVILVGIGNLDTHGTNMRGFDFHSQKTDNFLKFITEELIPIVDKRFNTDTNNLTGRTLIGHSSAAYFTMLVFFQYDSINHNYFHNFITLSGDFVKPLMDLFDEEITFFEKIGSQGEVNMALFLGVGSLEEDRFLYSFTTMRDVLISRQYNNLKLGSRIYLNHNHGSYIAEAIRDGLIFLFHESHTTKEETNWKSEVLVSQ